MRRGYLLIGVSLMLLPVFGTEAGLDRGGWRSARKWLLLRSEARSMWWAASRSQAWAMY